MSRAAAPRSSSGFTLIETMIALSVFVVIGYALVGAVGMGQSSSRQVISKAGSNAQLRKASLSFTDELVMANGATMTVTDLPDGNHQVDFMLPITVGNVQVWGVDEPMIGPNVGWMIRYTVEAQNGPEGVVNRLLRQVIDDAQVVQSTKVVAEGLRAGVAQPGFSCVQTGDVWVTTIRTEGDEASSHGKEMEFHVRIRN